MPRFEKVNGLYAGGASAEEFCGSSDRFYADRSREGSFETSRAGLGPTLWLQQPLPFAHGIAAPSKSF